LLAVGWVLAVLLAGCGGDLALNHDSSASRDISNLWLILLIGSTVIFAIVVVLLFGALRRRRRGGGDDPDRTEGRGVRGFVVVAGIVVPTVILAAVFALTVVSLPKTSPPAVPVALGGDASLAAEAPARQGDVVIEVVARQWFWDVRYPAAGVRTANEIHIPVGRRALIRLRSGDVVHSLWVPELNRKVDAIPGHTNTVVFDASRPGVFEGRCAEFCGLQHAHMRLYVVAQSEDDFAAWLAQEGEPAPDPETPELERGQQLFLSSACVYCHTIAGTNATGTVGPDLTHVASRLSLGAGTIPNARGYLAGWILDPQHLKPGNKMPGTDFDGADLQALLDYLETLR
jgi:cytochrome c oxidase subunit 2